MLGLVICLKCLAQGHSKQACRLVLHTILFVLSAKQGSCEYHFLKSFGMNRLENESRSTECEADAQTITPLSRCNFSLCLYSQEAEVAKDIKVMYYSKLERIKQHTT